MITFVYVKQSNNLLIMEDTLIEKWTIGKYNVETHYDLTPENPREMGNICKIIVCNRKYVLGDINLKENDFNSFDDFFNKMKRKYNPFVILPLYVLDHSGLHLSLTRLCQWDSSLIGVILIKKRELKNGFKLKKVTDNEITLAKTVINQELQTYNDYLVGNVYGFKIFENGEVVNSVWSFYDYDNMKTEISNLLN